MAELLLIFRRERRKKTMINIYEVTETNQMIAEENLDVRTITLGISLMDCIDSDLQKLNENIYNKITTMAKNLVSTGDEIEHEFGIPIVNKRISITPISLIGAAACKSPEDFVTIAKTLDRAAKEVGVNFIGGYSALVSKGMTKSEENLIRSIPEALSVTERICSSVNVGSTKTGINMDAVRLCGEIVKETAEATKENDSLGCAKLVIFCNAPDDNPFMAGAFLGVTEADAVINVGVSGPGVVKHAIEQVRGEGFEVLCETIKKTAFKVTRVGQLVAGAASKRLGIPFGIIDLSLAPTPAVGDSVAEILEEIGLERVGAPGTTAALAMLNDQVKKGVYLSGGEVQRIAIARAILKNAPILVLDEATAFADPENEAQLQKALAELQKGKTVIMVAHRLSTVQNADQIIVLDEGRISGIGTSKELLETNEIYREVYESQVKGGGDDE